MAFLNEFNTSEFNAQASVDQNLGSLSITGSSTYTADLSKINGLSAIFTGDTSTDINLSITLILDLQGIFTGSTDISSSLLTVDYVLNADISGTSTVSPDLIEGQTKTFEGIITGDSTVFDVSLTPYKGLMINVAGDTSTDINLIVGEIENLTTVISGDTSTNIDLLVGNLKTISADISGDSNLDSDLYVILNDSFPVDNLVIWNEDQQESFSYGNKDIDSRYFGTYSFKGQPTLTNRPTINLKFSNTDIDLSGYDQLWLFAKTDSTSSSNKIKLSFYNWPYSTTELNIDPYTDTSSISSEWQLFKIPFDDIEAVGNGWTRSEGLDFLYFGRATVEESYNIYVDNIRAIDTSAFDTSSPMVGEFKSVIFDDTPVLTSDTKTTYLENIGQTTLNIQSIDITGSDASNFSVYIPEPNNVFPSQLKPIEVNFVPGSIGDKKAYLVITHTSTPYGNTSTIELIGKSIGSEISLRDSSLDFGRLPSESTMTLHTSISNTGNAELRIFDITSNNTEFSVISYDSTVQPSSSTDVVVTFNYGVADAYFDGETSITANLTKSRDLETLITGSSEVDILLGMDIFPFGISEIICGSTASANLGVTYLLNQPTDEPNETRAFEGVSDVFATLDVNSGFNELTIDASSSATAFLSVEKTIETNIDGSGNVVIDSTTQDKPLQFIIDTSSVVSATLTREVNVSTIVDASSLFTADLTHIDFKIFMDGSSTVTAEMGRMKSIFGEKPFSFTYPIYSILQTTYPWQHNDVYSYDVGPPPKIIVYTTTELDDLLFDKANKTGETTHGNIALLSGIDGDLVDSGVHPDDLGTDIIDGGSY